MTLLCLIWLHGPPRTPYSPSSRRFVNPLYLRVADLPEYGAAPAELRAEVDALRPAIGSPEDLIDYGGVWRAKRAALELLYAPSAPATAVHPGLAHPAAAVPGGPDRGRQDAPDRRAVLVVNFRLRC